MSDKIVGGVVVYEPEILKLTRTLDSIKSQCSKIILFSNSPLNDKDLQNLKHSNNIEFLGKNTNMGLGHAHTELIKRAIEIGGGYLILSDQDTIYPSNYVENMLNLKYEKHTIACPAWIDLNDTATNVVDQHFLQKTRISIGKSDKIEQMAHGISSGMFINLKKLNANILPDENLFIDWIDNDWCWRLVSQGHEIIYNPNVTLKHDLGSSKIRFSTLSYTRRSPIRDYYILRNLIYILLYRNYKVRVKPYLLKKLIQHILFSLFSSRTNYFSRMKYIFKAIKDGLFKKLGIFH